MRTLPGTWLVGLIIVGCTGETGQSGETDAGSTSDATTAGASTAGVESGVASAETTSGIADDSGDFGSSSVGSSGPTASEDTGSQTTEAEGTTGTGGTPPPNTVIQGCNTAVGYDVTTYRAPGPVDTPVYAVGINHDGSFIGLPSYEVRWDLPGEGILVLTGYNEAEWNVIVEDGASLSRVLVLAYEPATVELTGSDAVVEIVEGFHDTAYEYPSLSGASLLTFAEQYLGEPVDGFDGCNEAEGAYIGESSTSQGPLPPPLEEPPSCTSIRDEAAYCLAIDSDFRYTLFGLDSGDVCTVQDGEGWGPTIRDMFAPGAGEEVIVCDALEPAYYTSEASVAGIDLSTGQMRWSDTGCGRVTRIGDGFGITDYKAGNLQVFDDYAAAEAGAPAYAVSNIAGGRLVEHEGVLYAGYTELQRYQLPGGEALGSITLAGSPYIRGISSALGSIVVFDGDVDGLQRYDPDDGSLLETIPLDLDIFFGGIDAMTCFDNQ